MTFRNNEQFLRNHPFPKGSCLIFGDLMQAGIDKNRLKTEKYKAKVRYFQVLVQTTYLII